MPAELSPTRSPAIVLLLVWLLSAVYLGANLNRGWVPHDEGTLGQAAERVLDGQIPNADFVDPYTGGLAYLDALLFKIFGINLFYLRVFLFVSFLAWVPTVYWIARKFLAPLSASAATLLAVVWSVPNYPAAIPSWFCLFLVSFGILSLANYIESPKTLWLVLAGLAAGVSFLFKSVALYFIAAALLFFVYREQRLSLGLCESPRKNFLYRAFVLTSLIAFALMLVKLVTPVAGPSEYFHFVFPGLLIVLLLAIRERSTSRASTGLRFLTLAKMAAPFLVSAAIPFAVFAGFYWSQNALGGLMHALFVAPGQRLNYARSAPLALILEVPSVLAVLFFLVFAEVRGKFQMLIALGAPVLAIGLLLVPVCQDISYLLILATVLGLTPIITPLAVRVLWTDLRESRFASDQLLALLLISTVLFSLIMFPFARPIYFAYVAPLLALLIARLLSKLRNSRGLIASVFVFLMIFGAFLFRTRALHQSSYRDYADVSLQLPRAGPLKVSPSDAATYRELVPFVRSLAGDHAIIAGPDCPQVYFLTGKSNLTPVLFDFLHDPVEYKDEMRALIDRPNAIGVLVVNEEPEFSVEELVVLQSLAKQSFNRSKTIGNFRVYWRQ